MVIKVVEKPAAASVVPWIITSIAFLVTAFALFSSKRIFIDVRVVDEKNPYLIAYNQGAAEELVSGAVQPPKETAQEKESGDLISMSQPVFEGAAKLKSASEKSGQMTLVNSSVAPFARASIRLSEPMNMSRAKIIFFARGTRGGENLAFALKDKDNVLAFDKGKFFPFPSRLTTDWQKAEIPLSAAVKEFNQKNVISLRFEFGSNIDNKPGDAIFVKDLQVIS